MDSADSCARLEDHAGGGILGLAWRLYSIVDVAHTDVSGGILPPPFHCGCIHSVPGRCVTDGGSSQNLAKVDQVRASVSDFRVPCHQGVRE